jgi:hypothetical protein
MVDGSLIHRLGVIHWLGMIHWLGVIHLLRVVHWLWVVHRLLLVATGHMGRSIVRVGHISNIARVGIGNGVLDRLEATVGKLDMVFTIGGVTITGLILAKLNLILVGINGMDTIGILVFGGSGLISGLMIRLGVGRCWVGVNRGVNWGVNWSMNWGVNGVRGTVIGDGNGHEGKEGNKNLKPEIMHVKRTQHIASARGVYFFLPSLFCVCEELL